MSVDEPAVCISGADDDDVQSEAVESQIDAMFAPQLDELVELAPLAAELLDRTRRSAAGGKRMRSALVLRTHGLLGGARHDAALHSAAAFELLHTSFLMHDDLIDGDWIRRGRPTLAAQYRDEHPRSGTERIGVAAGIIAGDVALHLAHRALGRAAERTPARLGALLHDEFAHAVLVSAVGELADVLSEGDERVRAPRSEEISSAKTAAYSFTAPIRTGALLAGADSTTIAALTLFARSAGTAFQIQDDLLGVFGDAAVTGKSVDGDVLLGKASLLVAHARATAGSATRDALEEARAGGDLTVIRRLLERLGSRRYSEDRIAQLLGEASSALESVPGALRDHLLAFVRSNSTRSR